MGKTFKQEKSFRPKKKPLNNHRDIPDNPDIDLDLDTPDDDEEAERYYGEKLRTQGRDNESQKSPKTP